jgi:2-keto-4-pentenoate hydratase/2-oxohepta-3-ene-1,7-dioic acid hydratase in catechol pathway
MKEGSRMRFATFISPENGNARLGIVQDEVILDIALISSRLGLLQRPANMLALIHSYNDYLPTLQLILQEGQGKAWSEISHFQDAVYSLADVVLQAPIPRPLKNVMCVGLNYRDHILETAAVHQRSSEAPEYPVFFTKAPTSVVGEGSIFTIDEEVSTQIDWEAELAVIIGKPGKNIPTDQALEYVFGYTILNDMTARDLQLRHKQFFKGKSLDGACPMGPWLVTGDEIPDPQSLHIALTVNGIVKQEATTGQMIFSVAELIASLSRGMTLEAGDIIATGTPSGVGVGRQPTEFLRPGDEVEIEIEKIGKLHTSIR